MEGTGGNTGEGSQVGVGVSALKVLTHLHPALVPDYSPHLSLRSSSSAKIRGQLLDERRSTGWEGQVAAQKPGLGPLFHTRIAPGSGRQLSGPE